MTLLDNITSSLASQVDPTSLVNQFELGNGDLSLYSSLKDTHSTVKELQIGLATGKVGFKIAKDVAGNMFVVLADHASSTGDAASVSYVPSTVQGLTFVTVAGLAGSVVCTAGDLLTLYNRGKELHELEKELASVKKNREHSLTHRFLQKKVNIQRCLVASSVIAVASDAVVMGTTIACTGGLGSGIGSTAVAAMRIAAEDHLNDSFIDDLYEFVNEFEETNPSLEDTPANKKNIEVHNALYDNLKQQYENAKSNYENAKKSKEEATKKLDRFTPVGLTGLEVGQSLALQKKEATEAFEAAEKALKHVEQGYPSCKALHEDFESYNACKDLITGLTTLREHRDRLKSHIKEFENTYQKEFGPFEEPYKKKHFGDVNPAWQKKVDHLNSKLKLKKQFAKIELRQAEDKYMAPCRKEYEKIKGKIDSEQAYIDLHAIRDGYSVQPPGVRQAEANILALKPLLKEAHDKYLAEFDKVQEIKKNIKEIKKKQAALEQYAKNWKNLSKVREKIFVKNRGLANTKTIKAADKTMSEQLSTETLLNDRNKVTYQQFKLEQQKAKNAPAVEGNDKLDVTNHGADLPTLAKQSSSADLEKTHHGLNLSQSEPQEVSHSSVSKKINVSDNVILPNEKSKAKLRAKTEHPISSDFTTYHTLPSIQTDFRESGKDVTPTEKIPTPEDSPVSQVSPSTGSLSNEQVDSISVADTDLFLTIT